MSDTSVGNDLPAMSATDDAAWKAMETAAATERGGLASGGQQTTQTTQQAQQTTQQQTTQQQKPAATTQQTAQQQTTQQTQTDDENIEGAVGANDGKKYVPVSTFVAERNALKGQKADLEAVNRQLQQQLDAALAAMSRIGQGGQQQTQQQKQPDPPPQNPHDKNLNPIEHMAWENDQLRKTVTDLQKRFQQGDEQQAQTQALTRQQTAYVNAHQTYAQKNPAYVPAYEFLMDKLVKTHTAMGYPQNVAIQMANNVEWNLVVNAMQRQQNPFVILTNLAREYGYTPQQQQQQTAEEKLKQSQDAAAASITLSGQPGGQAAVTSLQSLVNMPKEAFAAAFAGDVNDEKFMKIAMGGAP